LFFNRYVPITHTYRPVDFSHVGGETDGAVNM
jgi:hypothetical protein